MNSTNLHVLSNIISGVESHGQQYTDDRDWTAYAGAHTNSDKEVTCTLGPYQAYGDEAQQVCEYVNSAYPSVMAAIDTTGQIRAHIKSGFISTAWNPGATDKANLIKMLGTTAGHEACEHVFDERLLKYISNAESFGVKTIPGQMMWSEIEHLGGIMPTRRVFGRCRLDYSLGGILTALKKDREQTGDNSVSSAKYWSRHTACISMINAHAVPDGMTLTADSFVRQIAAVCAMAKSQHFKYGDSHTAIPCADQVISCDRMIARALYDFGFHDQGDGGIVISTMEKYLISHGWDKITSQSLKAGDIVLVSKGIPVHIFVVERFGSINDIDKYDVGTQERIDSGGHSTHAKLVEWADRTFYCAFRIHEDKKEESVTAENVMTLAAHYIGTKESPSGSNNVLFNTHYYGHAVSGADYPWCCAFVWDIFRMANASALFYGGNKTAACADYESWALGAGLSVGKNNGRYGDVVTFDFGGRGYAHHIGFIKSKNSDGTYQTIEGNTSVTSQDNGGAVMERTRSQGDMRYIFRPKYSASPTPEPTPTGDKYMFNINRVLTIGMTGTDVLLLEEILKARGFYTGNLDRSFGPQLRAAVIKYQQSRGLDPDGQAGPKTLADLIAL